jgi:hypothetical protein
MEVEVPDDVLLDNMITSCPKVEVPIDKLLGSMGLSSLVRIYTLGSTQEVRI